MTTILARRNAQDLHSTAGIDLDHYHRKMNKKSKVVPSAYRDLARIHTLFFHDVGSSLTEPSLGVSMSRCSYKGEGVEFRHSCVNNLLPPHLQSHGNSSHFRICWPGYESVHYTGVIKLASTMGDLASQIALTFSQFIDRHYKDFHEEEGVTGILLGPSGVQFGDVRLCSIFYDGLFWNMEAEYVHD
ncbi:hypothetical protein FA15DRAFT_743974 [Coprinopsis marcescibilis]|uniref:Uncharacterized protein n=1 Tax=Coprinopsis marcescibilis TaxID=230819 RepID=A0A5C3KT26_COPMA|nr:hypothetical protein FA15DRAFT_743974 [Coprinopsis marcescibilis]